MSPGSHSKEFFLNVDRPPSSALCLSETHRVKFTAPVPPVYRFHITHTHTHTHTPTPTPPNIHTHTHAQPHTHTRTHTHTLLQAHTHTLLKAHTPRHPHTLY